ncbi:hypothetical protein GCM10020358_62640 [Amorphoplanes nipponensis]|uniref:LPXTG-motif cell wall anchor domain-containing protein n=1 Tax=Actinoplanes nipponensis TaxID=135950 RepID=A0A919JS66_9ACTN|nr:hypothetical protein Ani05nite_55330 [Actinoplanes nipponensis]
MALRMNNLAMRLVLPVALLGMTAVGAATPAYAEAGAARPDLEISVPDRVVTTAGGTKSVPFEVVNTGRTPATGLVVDFATAAAPLDPRLGFQPPAGCTATGCAVGDLATGARKAYTFTVTPTKELPASGAGLTLSAHDADGEWHEAVTVTVVRAAGGIDLETAAIPELKLAAGASAVLPIKVRNNGDQPTEGIAIALAAPRYLTFPKQYANCVEVADLPGVVCAFDLALAPGSVFSIAPSTPITIAADKAAPGPARYDAGMYAFGLDDEDTDAASLAAATEALKQPGAKLKLVPAVQALAVDDSELNEWDNVISFRVRVPLNQADSVAIGDAFEGKVGDTRTVEVGFRNDGPAAVLPPPAKGKHAARVHIPSGLKLTKVDKDCVPDGDGEPSWNRPGQVSGHDYLCVAAASLAPGAKALFSFTAKIENGDNEDAGSITVDGGVQDKKTSNNVAKIEVKLTTGTGSGGTGGGLPVTGAPTGRIAGVGMLFVLTGALALVLTRRRRTV